MESAWGRLVKAATFSKFQGLDLRNVPEASPADTVQVARNVDLTTGGGFKVRSRLRLYATVDVRSFGLYVANDELRCAMPWHASAGPDPMPMPPYGVAYDFLSANDGQFTFPFTVVALPGASAFDNAPYLSVEISDTPFKTYQHHYVTDTRTPLTVAASTLTTVTFVETIPATLQATPGWTLWVHSALPVFPEQVVTAVLGPNQVQVSPGFATPPAVAIPCEGVYPFRTLVVGQPFIPGPAILVHARRVWASDLQTRDTYYSALDTATDWTGGDSGNLRTSLHIDGSQFIQGFGVFKANLVVICERATQSWRVVDYDPDTFIMEDNVGGAGTKWPKSVANVMGDLLYFSEGGFRSLSAVVTTGQLKEDDVGAKILAVTRNLDIADRPPIAVWSPAQSKYQCAIDTTHYVFTYSPRSNVSGWTTYTLPFDITAMVEWRGNIYARRKDSAEIYVFDAEQPTEAGFSWEVEFAWIDLAEGTDAAGHLTHVRFIDLHQTGACKLDVALDPNDPTDTVYALEITGSTTNAGKIPLHIMSDLFQPKFYGTLDWELGALTYRYQVGNLV